MLLKRLKKKKPDVLSNSFLFSKGLHLPDVFIKGMAYNLEDFAKNTKEFSTFGVDQNKVVSLLKNILINISFLRVNSFKPLINTIR